jgi:L-lactate dehydrogenase
MNFLNKNFNHLLQNNMNKEFTSQKIAVIGAGAVGSTATYVAMIKNIASEIILIDINEQKEKGEVMDIADGLCFVETGAVKCGTFSDAKNADVIVITAGAPQKPGETRLELVDKNKNILKSILKSIGKLKETSIVLLIANPVDVLTHEAQKITGLPPSQVFGSGTSLDSARLKTHVARHFNVSPSSVNGFVLGEHGDSEFVPWSTVTIGSMQIQKLKGFNKKIADKIENKIKKEAYEIINRKGATYYGIGLVIAELLEAILYNKHEIFPITSLLNGWNGVSGVCLGAPAVIGRKGIEKHWPLNLTSEEKKKLLHSAQEIKKYL